MSTPTAEAVKPTEEKVVEKTATSEPMETDPKPEAAEKKADAVQSEEKAEDKSKDADAAKPAPVDPTKKPETFFVETPNTPKKSFEGAKNAVKKKAIELRPQLMKFPGALRIHCAKTAEEGKFAIVIRIEKPAKPEEFKLPEEFGELMKLDKEATEAKKKDGFCGEYELKDQSYRIWIKIFEAGKIESLDAPKNVTGRIRNPKKVYEFEIDETNPAAGESKPADATPATESKPGTEEAKPPATEEAKPAATEAEIKPAGEAKAAEAEEGAKPAKRPREDAATEEAPAAKRAKVAEEETKPMYAAAAAAVC